jgi:hypothetical protein
MFVSVAAEFDSDGREELVVPREPDERSTLKLDLNRLCRPPKRD